MTVYLNGSQMTEEDIEYIMARIYAMEEARKNLGRAIKEDKEYLLKAMGERDVLETPSFTAKMNTRTRAHPLHPHRTAVWPVL